MEPQYEILLDTVNQTPIPFAIAIFAIIEIIIIRIATVLWRKFFTGERILSVMMIALCGLIAFGYMFNFFDMKTNVTDKYFNGDFEVTEGVITDYVAVDSGDLTGCDTFKVNGISFKTESLTGYGNLQNQCDGGQLTNHVKVKISYVTYKGENVIMKAEVPLY